MRRHCDRFFGQLPITLVAIVLLAGCATEPDAVEITPGLQAFIGARIIDGTGETPIEEGVLIVRDGEIETVGASDAVEVPADAERIDATGRTIIPGLINTHGARQRCERAPVRSQLLHRRARARSAGVVRAVRRDDRRQPRRGRGSRHSGAGPARHARVESRTALRGGSGRHRTKRLMTPGPT